jgi:HD-GYP domain-containing protein (c-di-GMP phosphodiesterase class II)
MIVGAHAVLHGLGPSMLAVLLGGIVVPGAIQANVATNPTDWLYAVIYLFGAALLPWSGRQLARRRADALRHQLRLTQEMEREAVLVLARAAEAKDQVTGDHVMRVGDIAAAVGVRAGLSRTDAEDLRFAGMLHDVGKLHLPDRLLIKAGPLTRAEWRLVKNHTIWGERILGDSEGFEMARRIARSHHENWDGSGYPDGLAADQIPLPARIVRLADVWDALRSDRPYKAAWPLARCLEEIERGAGSLFDPALAAELVALVNATLHADDERLVAAFSTLDPTAARTGRRKTMVPAPTGLLAL